MPSLPTDPLPPLYPAGEIDEHAPEVTTRAPLVLYFHVATNDALDVGDGGSLVMAPIRELRYTAGVCRAPHGAIEPVVIDARLPLSCASDHFLATFPFKTRQAKERTVFRVTVEPVALEDLPPDFDPSWYQDDAPAGPVPIGDPTRVAVLEAENAQLRAQLAASTGAVAEAPAAEEDAGAPCSDSTLAR